MMRLRYGLTAVLVALSFQLALVPLGGVIVVDAQRTPGVAPSVAAKGERE